jgi:hypothetical protein
MKANYCIVTLVQVSERGIRLPPCTVSEYVLVIVFIHFCRIVPKIPLHPYGRKVTEFILSVFTPIMR